MNDHAIPEDYEKNGSFLTKQFKFKLAVSCLFNPSGIWWWENASHKLWQDLPHGERCSFLSERKAKALRKIIQICYPGREWASPIVKTIMSNSTGFFHLGPTSFIFFLSSQNLKMMIWNGLMITHSGNQLIWKVNITAAGIAWLIRYRGQFPVWVGMWKGELVDLDWFHQIDGWLRLSQLRGKKIWPWLRTSFYELNSMASGINCGERTGFGSRDLLIGWNSG